MRRVIAIARKEMYHILRDPRSLFVSVLMPVAMVLLFGYAIDMELHDMPVGVLDWDHSVTSRQMIRDMTSSGFIIDAQYLTSLDQVETGFRSGHYMAVLVIPRGLERDLENGSNASVQVIIDGADASTSPTVMNYMTALIMRYNQQINAELTGRGGEIIQVQTRYFFNPELVSANFIVPGIVAIVLIMICALLTSIAVAREKETGTMEQILTTPVAAREVIIGKVLPYMFLGSLDAALVLIVGKFVFNVPMEGNWFVLAGYSLIYVGIALSLGLMISAVSKTQQVAMMLAIVATLLPTVILGGFIFDHSSMPWWLQAISKIVPATYYIIIIRGVMLAGESWFPLEGGIMLAMMVLILTAAVKRFKSRLE